VTVSYTRGLQTYWGRSGTLKAEFVHVVLSLLMSRGARLKRVNAYGRILHEERTCHRYVRGLFIKYC
jgi:hypothetical protein